MGMGHHVQLFYPTTCTTLLSPLPPTLHFHDYTSLALLTIFFFSLKLVILPCNYPHILDVCLTSTTQSFLYPALLIKPTSLTSSPHHTFQPTINRDTSFYSHMANSSSQEHLTSFTWAINNFI